MYYIGAFNFMYIYTILSYSIAVFIMERFPANEKAIFFVGVILALASFLGLFLNGIWIYFQKTFSSKILILIATGGIFISVGIFLLSQFIFPILAIPAFTLLAACFYIWSYDLYDITMTTIILNRAKDNEQTTQFSEKKIAESIGMLMGIITGGLLMIFGSSTAQFFLFVFLVFLFLYFRTHFENEKDDIELVFSKESGVEWKKVLKSISKPEAVQSHMKTASQNLQKKVLHVSKAVSQEIEKEIKNIPDTAVESITHASKKTKTLLNQARILVIDILAKENEIQRKTIPKHNFHIKEIFSEIGSSFMILGNAFSFSTRYAFFLAAVMIMFFSFWDTMAVTYQPIFLQRFHETLGVFTVFIMPLFILPIFLLQVPFARLSQKLGTHIMILMGLGISAISLVLLGTLESLWGGSITMLLLAGMGNSIGYTAAFSSSQVHFSQEIKYYFYSIDQPENNGRIAATLRLALNIGNIVGQLFGGVIFALLGFLLGFLSLGMILLFVFLMSLLFVGRLKTPLKQRKDASFL